MFYLKNGAEVCDINWKLQIENVQDLLVTSSRFIAKFRLQIFLCLKLFMLSFDKSWSQFSVLKFVKSELLLSKVHGFGSCIFYSCLNYQSKVRGFGGCILFMLEK